MILNIKRKYRKVYGQQTDLDKVTEGWVLDKASDWYMFFLKESDPTQQMQIAYRKKDHDKSDDLDDVIFEEIVYIKTYSTIDDRYTKYRQDGPAMIRFWTNGNIKEERWYTDFTGDVHRENGPAVIEYYQDGKIRSEDYVLHNLIHREDGPASIRYNRDGKIISKRWRIENLTIKEENSLGEVTIHYPELVKKYF